MSRICSTEGCGKKHSSRGLCKACYQDWRRNNHPEGLTCEYDERALYAKGLCWPHYQKLTQTGYVIGPPQPGRLPKPVICKRCGEPFKRRKKGRTEREQTLCRTCIWFRDCRKCGSGFDAANTSYQYCPECRFDDFYEYWKHWVDQNRDDYNRYKRSVNSRRRATTGDDFTHEEIFERDNWTCGICEEPVDPELQHPDPMSASLDHIIPISQDGPHTRANVRCTHLDCNVRRHVGKYDDPIQLALV